LWDRTKFLLLFALLFHLLVWNEFVRFGPPETWWDAEAQVAYQQQWLLWLAGLEVLRQLHFFVSERNARYNRFWTQRVFGSTTRWYERRVNPWNRYRLARVVRWLFLLAILSVIYWLLKNTQAGRSYTFYCSLHPGMRGTLAVVD